MLKGAAIFIVMAGKKIFSQLINVDVLSICSAFFSLAVRVGSFQMFRDPPHASSGD